MHSTTLGGAQGQRSSPFPFPSKQHSLPPDYQMEGWLRNLAHTMICSNIPRNLFKKYIYIVEFFTEGKGEG